METWKDITGYNGIYQISNFGNVKSFARKEPRLLVGFITNNGYRSVLINYKGKRKTCNVHRLVANAFIPNISNKPYINHIDGNKTNNHLSNIEWCTHSENMSHGIENNLFSKGTNVNTNKLTEEQVLEIYRSSLSHRELAKKYNVDKSTPGFIKTGRSWRWLTKHE